MNIFVKLVITVLFIGLAAAITGLTTVDNKTAQRICITTEIICGIITFSCLICLIWQL